MSIQMEDLTPRHIKDISNWAADILPPMLQREISVNLLSASVLHRIYSFDASSVVEELFENKYPECGFYSNLILTGYQALIVDNSGPNGAHPIALVEFATTGSENTWNFSHFITGPRVEWFAQSMYELDRLGIACTNGYILYTVRVPLLHLNALWLKALPDNPEADIVFVPNGELDTQINSDALSAEFPIKPNQRKPMTVTNRGTYFKYVKAVVHNKYFHEFTKA